MKKTITAVAFYLLSAEPNIRFSILPALAFIHCVNLTNFAVALAGYFILLKLFRFYLYNSVDKILICILQLYVSYPPNNVP